jgi:hypothetical protein
LSVLASPSKAKARPLPVTTAAVRATAGNILLMNLSFTDGELKARGNVAARCGGRETTVSAACTPVTCSQQALRNHSVMSKDPFFVRSNEPFLVASRFPSDGSPPLAALAALAASGEDGVPTLSRG